MQFTVKQINDALSQLIKEQPDFKYSGWKTTFCYYHQGPRGNEDSCDGCIFGQALQRLGVSKDSLAVLGSIPQISLPFLPPSAKRPDYWGCMQRAQDNGESWGDLLKYLPTTE